MWFTTHSRISLIAGHIVTNSMRIQKNCGNSNNFLAVDHDSDEVRFDDIDIFESERIYAAF